MPPEIGVLHGLAWSGSPPAFPPPATAIVKHRDALGQFEDRVHVVLDDDQRAAPPDRRGSGARRRRSVGAHAGQRLIQQQHIRAGGERDADLQPPLLAVGQHVHRQRRRGRSDPTRRQRRSHLPLHRRGCCRRGAEVQRGTRHALRASAAMRRFSRTVRARNSWLSWLLLPMPSCAGARSAPRPVMRRSNRRTSPAGRGDLIQQHLEQRGFAGAVRADHRVDGAGAHRRRRRPATARRPP